MNFNELQDKINQAALVIGKTWPLYSFVTSNPLSGFEKQPFFDGIKEAGNLWGAHTLPSGKIFKQAWKEGKIERSQIEQLLKSINKNETPEYYLNQLLEDEPTEYINEYHELDFLTIKWVSLFLDEGMSEWSMPLKDMGFYTAWRNLIIYDNDIKKSINGTIPKTAEEALSRILDNFNEEEQITLLEGHLVALPGWAGYIKYRVENNSNWNKEYPINLLEYLAVRLWMARCLQVPLIPNNPTKNNHEKLVLKYTWLTAWEQTWQKRCFEKLSKSQEKENTKENNTIPDAQLVFCLDSRSELLRRHLESLGNYETFGSAGAFGLAMDYSNPETGLINKSSPAMIPSKFIIHEKTKQGQEEITENYKLSVKKNTAYHYFLKRMKHILPSAFGFVELAGYNYGLYALLRLFSPNLADKMKLKHHKGYEAIFDPNIYSIESLDVSQEISIEEKSRIVKGVFDSCGWKEFASIVIFTGHASHSANNPFASSLDCGACAGNPGKRNARALARIANDHEVRAFLKENLNISIPEETIFLAAEHITSSDEIHLFDHGVSENHLPILQQLKRDLSEVKKRMTEERLNESVNAEKKAKTKSNLWSETRPEWGLSGHAGYIIAPRSLTKNGKFDDCFMSSYDWELDRNGSILKGIMQGPLLVCQWISNHYYFATVDNEIFGGGSKIAHNVTGKYGVIQGNGSDLKMGLPLQSLMKTDDKIYHNPIRLTTIIQAPIKFVNDILESDEDLKGLINHEWIHLFIMDPLDDNKISKI